MENTTKEIQRVDTPVFDKPRGDITKKDIVDYISKHDIQLLNFRYVGGDGRLKTLTFTTRDMRHVDSVLSLGERVDGSSLFSHMQTGSSDLYVVPRYKTIFRNPFSEIPAVDILCDFLDKDGNEPADIPAAIVKKAHRSLTEWTGYTLHAMGELEYYCISDEDHLYRPADQSGYHESGPFTKWHDLRNEAMVAIARCGGNIKYGHSEVGNFTADGRTYEQNEIEFLPDRLEDAADQLVLAKWVLRMLGYKYGVTISLAPKIIVGKAGSGLHVHMRLMKGDGTATLEKGILSNAAKKAIAGVLDLAPSLTAFGNTVPLSYLRLVPHQEAPTSICWGERNRAALVRVPLGWTGDVPGRIERRLGGGTGGEDVDLRQTYEFRASDGSADIYLLFAGLAVATRHGLEMPGALERAADLHIDSGSNHKNFALLPGSCAESAEALKASKDVYMKDGVFPASVIDAQVRRLRSHDDMNNFENSEDREAKVKKLVEEYLHCM